MDNDKFNDFRKYIVGNLKLSRKTAQDYISGLKKLDDILSGTMIERNFVEFDHYLQDICILLVQSDRIKPGYKKNIKSALFQFHNYVMAKHDMVNQETQKSFVAAWLKFAETTEQIKMRLNCTSNITGDFGEFLISDVFGYQKAKNSEKTIDLVDENGKTYQVKTRKVSASSSATSLGICRSLEFDFLISILLAPTGTVFKVLKHNRRTQLKPFIPKKNVHQSGFVFVTTQEFQEKGEDISAQVFKKYPNLKSHHQPG